MGMQDRNCTRDTLKLLVILGKGSYRLPDTLDHQCIEQALMAPDQRPEFGGERKGQ